MTFDSMCEARDPKLSAYLDGELSSFEQAELAAHLAACDRCRDVLDGYRRVTNRAAGLEGPPGPPRDLWPGIAERIGAHVSEAQPAATSPKRWSIVRPRIPQLLAAGLVALIAVGAVWAYWPGQTAPTELSDYSPVAVQFASTRSVTGFETAIADLIRALDEAKADLDPNTVRVIEENLAVIDQALARANEALAADPESDYLRRHVVRTSRLKFQMLQRVTTLTSAD